jgi:hypothetical protein
MAAVRQVPNLIHHENGLRLIDLIVKSEPSSFRAFFGHMVGCLMLALRVFIPTEQLKASYQTSVIVT